MKKTIFATDRLKTEDVYSTLGDSSGMILSEEDDKISIGYVDYDVSDFGGRDYECYYDLDAENSALLRAALGKKYSGDLFDMCAVAFTLKFSNRLFEGFCSNNNIKYTKNTY